MQGEDVLYIVLLSLRLMCWRGRSVYATLSCMLLKVLVHELRALVAQNAKHLGNMESLELIARRDLVNELGRFLRDHDSNLVLYWDELPMKKGTSITLSSCCTRRPATTKSRLPSMLRSAQ